MTTMEGRHGTEQTKAQLKAYRKATQAPLIEPPPKLTIGDRETAEEIYDFLIEDKIFPKPSTPGTKEAYMETCRFIAYIFHYGGTDFREFTSTRPPSSEKEESGADYSIKLMRKASDKVISGKEYDTYGKERKVEISDDEKVRRAKLGFSLKSKPSRTVVTYSILNYVIKNHYPQHKNKTIFVVPG